MSHTLDALRQTPQPTPTNFLALQPGCFLQYYDDTPTKDATKALSSRSFDAALAKRKQQDHCAVTFSLQAFAGSRTKEGLLCYRSLGVDIDLIPAAERRTVSAEEADRRKEEYLQRHLLPFPLKPHWLVETAHGFHGIWRVRPLRHPRDVQKAETLNRRLVRVLRGDPNAALLTQVLRVPGFFQFKDPAHPFLCRLLIDNGGTIAPYDVALVEGILDTWDAAHGAEPPAGPTASSQRPRGGDGTPRWGEGLAGVPEGQRNATAASVIGMILCRLPIALWETAGWGGLKEWNGRNASPLPERELRVVYDSIARREYAKRQLQRWAERTKGPEAATNQSFSPMPPC